MSRTMLAGLFLLILLVPAAAFSQWLGPHLDSQRWSNLRKHQQKMRRNSADQKKASAMDKAKANKATSKSKPNSSIAKPPASRIKRTSEPKA